MSLISKVLDEVQRARTENPTNKEVHRIPNSHGKNEFLFILKPEVFAKVDTQVSRSILDLVFDRMASFDISVDNIRVLNAAYLDKYDVVAKHYGVINAVSKNFKANITDEVTFNFKKHYQQDISDVNIYGSIELLNTHSEINAEVLMNLWNSVEIKRLAGGIYSGHAIYNGENIYIVNGFHPPQLAHFIASNRVIVTMSLSGNIDWQEARNMFIGNTYPEKANKGSLRRDIFDSYGKLGFDDVSYVINSVHLSAGPLEGLLELQRFNSEFHLHNTSSPTDFGFGQLLAKNFSKETLNYILSNPTVEANKKQISLFDHTEEMNQLIALDAIKTALMAI